MSELLDVLDEVEGKVIIWANYVYDIRQIVKAISKNTEDSIVQYWAIPADVRQKHRNVSRSKSDSRFFVGNHRQVGMVYITAANNVIYYSNGYDLEKDCIRRQGTQNRTEKSCNVRRSYSTKNCG